MNLKKNLLIMAICLCSSLLFSIEVADKKDRKLSLETKILMGALFDLNDLNWELNVPGVVLELDGELNEKFSFNLSLDVGDAVSDHVSRLLKEVYFTWDTTFSSRLRAGQFNVPFGEEETLGRYGRMYLSHSKGTGSIAPGTDRGIVFSLRDVGELFDFDFGLFNGLGTPYDDISLNNLLISSRQVLQLEPSIWLNIEGGYAFAFELSQSEVLFFDFSHVAYAKLEYDLGLERKLFFLVEYMEKHRILDTLNNTGGWELDLFATAGFNYESWDFFASFDYYRLDSRYNMPDDFWSLGGGVNLRPADDVKLTLFYEGQNYFNNSDFRHKAGLNAYFRL